MGKFVNPIDMANELFVLFKRTKYECNSRKLQKLIIFSDMIYYIRSGYTKRLLTETDITANECGLGVNSILTPPYSIVINYLNNFDIIKDSDIDDNLEVNLASVYNYKPNALDVEVKTLLRKAFCEFGAVYGDYLSLMSRKTDIWKTARNDGTSEHYITTSLYDKYLQNKKDESALIEYLKGLIEDEQNGN